jgi:hypothetical protein
MKVTYIDNEPKYKVGDTAVTQNGEVFEITEIKKEDIPKWRRQAYEEAVRVGKYINVYAHKDGTHNNYAYLYRLKDHFINEGAIRGTGVPALTEMLTKITIERDEYKAAIDSIYMSIEPWYPSE